MRLKGHLEGYSLVAKGVGFLPFSGGAIVLSCTIRKNLIGHTFCKRKLREISLEVFLGVVQLFFFF